MKEDLKPKDMIKQAIGLTAILAISSLFNGNLAGAMDLIDPGSYSATTIVVPAIESTPTTIDNYPRNRHHRRQQTVIPQPNNIYPGNDRANCTTTIIGSLIPSPIPIDRQSGQPCR